MKYLGHIIENSTIHVNLDKFVAVQTWPMLICVKEIQQILSLANYYQEYVKNFAKLATPLSDF